MMQHRAAKLHIENIAFERNDQTLFSQINCDLQSGELLQIQGPNGSGKSTLLRVLAGFIEPGEGTLFWNGHTIQNELNAYQQNLHYIGHQHGLKTSLTVIENIQLNCALTANKTILSTINDILKKIGLNQSQHMQASRLSAGQLRRLSLAKLLLNPLPLWILDEPTTALDAEGQSLLMNLLEEHLATGGIAILATHHPLPLKRLVKTLQLGGQYA